MTHNDEDRQKDQEDYRRIFGEEPPMVGAIAIMTDTDNTQQSAVAWYDDIRIAPTASTPEEFSHD